MFFFKRRQPRERRASIFSRAAISWSLGVAFFLTIIVVVPYSIRFHFLKSNSNNDWTAFGTYVGGTLGPAYTLLAFAGFLYTIHLQRRDARTKELHDIADDATKQIEDQREDFSKKVETFAYLVHPDKKQMMIDDPVFQFIAFQIEKLTKARDELAAFSPDYVLQSSVPLTTRNMEQHLFGIGLLSKETNETFLRRLPRAVI